MRKRMYFGLVLTILAGGIVAAQDYESSNVNFLSNLSLAEMGAGLGQSGNDLWGWTDSTTGREYAIFGRSDGTAFVDVTDPLQPSYLGNLPSFTGSSAWRDMKVYDDDASGKAYAYIVSDGNGPHGMQIFDLTQLRGIEQPQTIHTTIHHNSFRNAHNLSINQDTGFAFVAGSNRANGGLHILDLNADPMAPVIAGEFSSDGYTHDTQVVVYNGPDSTYEGHEIAFNSNEDTLTIVDVSDKSATVQLSRAGYAQSAYLHQGWLSEDHRYFFQGDELDEVYFFDVPYTRTHIWDVQDLDSPNYLGFYEHDGIASIDHNLYVKDDLIFEANYSAGLRILKINDAAALDLEEVGYFDTVPQDNGQFFGGTWSVYPYFASGNIIVSDIQTGLWVVRMGKVCDFNEDDLCDLADIDLLTEQGDLLAGIPAESSSRFDMNRDGVIDGEDIDQFLLRAGEENGLAFYYQGDANLDGIVDLVDLETWFTNQFDQDAVWSSGDLNGDGAVDASDFNIWNEFKFNESPALPTNAVPEPSLTLAMLAFGWLLRVALSGSHFQFRVPSEDPQYGHQRHQQ